MTKTISLRESISISTTAEKIFDYISNVNNDVKWRPEVERMDVQGEIAVGTRIIEYITIYRFFHIVTPVEFRVLDRPYKFMVETPATHPTWVQCIRTIEPDENGNSEFTVQLSFSLDNMKQVLPFLPPAGLVKMWYKPRIRKYLKNLKRILETDG